MASSDTAERFTKWVTVIQSIVVTIAIVIGGGWTLYSFRATKAVEKAALDLEIAKARKPLIELSIEAKGYLGTDPGGGNKDTHRFIQAVVNLKNAGNTPIDVDLSEPSLYVGEVNIFKGDLVADENLYRLKHLTTLNYRKFSLPPGNSVQLPYLQNVRRSGLHFVEFRLNWPKEVANIPGAVTGFAGNDQRYAVMSAFVDVPDSGLSRVSTTSRVGSKGH